MAKECPRCGSRQVAPVIYSLGELAALRAGARGARTRVEDPDAPNWECQQCSFRWPDPMRLEVAREVLDFYERAKADLATT